MTTPTTDPAEAQGWNPKSVWEYCHRCDRVRGECSCPNPLWTPDLVENLPRLPDYPLLDTTEGAHPAWWRGERHAAEQWRGQVAEKDARIADLERENAVQAEALLLAARENAALTERAEKAEASAHRANSIVSPLIRDKNYFDQLNDELEAKLEASQKQVAELTERAERAEEKYRISEGALDKAVIAWDDCEVERDNAQAEAGRLREALIKIRDQAWKYADKPGPAVTLRGITVYIEDDLGIRDDAPAPATGEGEQGEPDVLVLPGNMAAVWSTRDAIEKVLQFAEMLLRTGDYDGHGWEQLQCAAESLRGVIGPSPSPGEPSGAGVEE